MHTGRPSVGEDRYAVYEGRKPRIPQSPVRVVAEDGTAFHVMHVDRLRGDQTGPVLSLLDAIREAFRQAERELPT